MRSLLIPPLLLLLTACASKTAVKDSSDEVCLTTHGIHSAKLMGLAEPDWEVPPEHICGPDKTEN